MKIFAIDPGNVESAYCLIDDKELRPLEFNKVPNTDLVELLRFFGRCTNAPDVVVIERVASYGMAVGQTVFQTCEWIGRFAEASLMAGLPVDYLYRQDEKLHICRDSRAKDANIRRALIDRFAQHDLKNGKGTKKKPDFFYGFRADIWAAYAVAITWAENRGLKENE